MSDLQFVTVSSEKVIKNINIQSCINCVHYKPLYSITNFDNYYNKCNNFGSKNVITNKISYDLAIMCRNDESKCGIEGKYFKQDKNIKLKIFTHHIISKIPIILFVSTALVSSVILNRYLT
jgi:hypothetical protein